MTLAAPNGQWRCAGITDVGKLRKHNEDALLNRADLGLWVVADGMGGHQRGEVASALLCAELARIPGNLSLAGAVDAIDERTLEVNARLVAMAAEMDEGAVIGCTLVAMVARGAFCACLWAGDSRLYRLRQGQLYLLSEDHSPNSHYGSAGDTVTSVKSNFITRAVGADSSLHLDVDCFALEVRDRFLLCSDGLSDEISDSGISTLLAGGDCDESAERLVAEALRNGGRDNVTAVILDYCGA